MSGTAPSDVDEFNWKDEPIADDAIYPWSDSSQARTKRTSWVCSEVVVRSVREGRKVIEASGSTGLQPSGAMLDGG